MLPRMPSWVRVHDGRCSRCLYGLCVHTAGCTRAGRQRQRLDLGEDRAGARAQRQVARGCPRRHASAALASRSRTAQASVSEVDRCRPHRCGGTAYSGRDGAGRDSARRARCVAQSLALVRRQTDATVGAASRPPNRRLFDLRSDNRTRRRQLSADGILSRTKREAHRRRLGAHRGLLLQAARPNLPAQTRQGPDAGRPHNRARPRGLAGGHRNRPKSLPGFRRLRFLPGSLPFRSVEEDQNEQLWHLGAFVRDTAKDRHVRTVAQDRSTVLG